MPTPHVIRGARVFFGPYDTSDMKTELAIDFGAEEKNAARMETGRVAVVHPGLMRVAGKLKALWHAGTIVAPGKLPEDNIAFTAVGDVVPHPLSYCPVDGYTGGVDGKVGMFWQASYMKVSQGGAVGELLPIEVDAPIAASRLVRGTFMLEGQKTVAGNGTARQLGAVLSGQRVYCAIHLLEFNGTTVTFTLQSDNAVGFPSPTTVLTLGPLTAAGDDFDEIAGPITDDWWRIAYTGTFTNFTAIAIVGIAAGGL